MVKRKSEELHFSTCIQVHMTKHPSQKVMKFRHLLGCDTIERTQNLIFDAQEKTRYLIILNWDLLSGLKLKNGTLG